MLKIELNEATGIAILEPEGALSEKDFIYASSVIDPYIEKSGKLNGLIINTRKFPGWESFGSLIKHFKFVKDQPAILKISLSGTYLFISSESHRLLLY